MSGVVRNPFKTIIVTGVPGVGKTTVLNKLKEEASRRGIKILILNFGDYMLKTAVEKGLVENRDQLRRLPHRKQLELQRDAARSIIRDALKELGDTGVLIVDTHSVVKTTAGYWPGLPEHVIKELNPDSIVLIEAEPNEIIERQLADKTRYRKDILEGGEEAIREMLLMARTAAMASATLTASSVFIARNPQGRIEEAVESILSLIEKV